MEQILSAACDWTEDSIRLTVSPSLMTKSMFFYVQEIGHFYALEGYYTERMNLSSYLIVLTLHGQGELEYQGGQYVLKRGDLFFIDCREYQRYQTSAGGEWELLWVHVEGAQTRDYYRVFCERGDPVLTVSDMTKIQGLIFDLISVQKTRDVTAEILSSKLIVEILTELLMGRFYNSSNQRYPVLPDYILRIREFIQTSFQQKLSLERISSKYSINKFYLARQFKKYAGVTVSQHILHVRLNEAQRRLKDTDLTITEISDQVGFETASYFIQVFRKHLGCTPLQYRKSWKGEKSEAKSDIFKYVQTETIQNKKKQ